MSKRNQQVASIEKLVSELERALATEANTTKAISDAVVIIEALKKGTAQIAARRRMIVRGLHASGLSYQMIADRLGLAKGTVVYIDKGKG